LTCASANPSRQNITLAATNAASKAKLKSLDILTYPPPAILPGVKLGSKSKYFGSPVVGIQSEALPSP
jgi:hypothetical protein